MRHSGEWIAIQCKCYDEHHRLAKAGIDAFLGGSQHEIFRLRWIAATCDWTGTAERAIDQASPPVRRIDFSRYHYVVIPGGYSHRTAGPGGYSRRTPEATAPRPVQEPWTLQHEAIEDVVNGLGAQGHDRGRLIMACGTGKTFTSLRIAERIVPDGGAILFAAPSIALVDNARREWLRHSTRPLSSLVVCSDRTAGGRGEEDMRISELECPVTTDPREIADTLGGEGATTNSQTRVVFSTYQSLDRVIAAQAERAAPAFDLAIADEAHRTTGAIHLDRPSKVDFQAFHDAKRLVATKRLYMTATPRLYSQRSKDSLKGRGIEVVDMADQATYGPELHRLKFAAAVKAGKLSDYRVIVLGVTAAAVTPGLRQRLEALQANAPDSKMRLTTSDMARALGVSLALNGVTEGASALERPERLTRSLAFANTIARSRWYASALMESQLPSATTRRLRGRDGATVQAAMKVEAVHLDAASSARKRNRELERLGEVDGAGNTCRVITNVRLFTEGVNVPTLDAVAFLDPRESQIDVVQAVGRVMRKAEGKRFGYIIVPVVIAPDTDILASLESGTDGYRTIGRVLRALQAHDERLAEEPATFVKVMEARTETAPGGGESVSDQNEIQGVLDLKEAEQAVYAHVAAASGLSKPGEVVADEITHAVRYAGDCFEAEDAHGKLAAALDLPDEDDGGARGVSTIAALMLCNACLLQRRLREEPGMEMIARLDRTAHARHPAEALTQAWTQILQRDYAPVFRPALAVLKALPEGKIITDAIRSLAECANRVAAALSEMGLDHAGPLYHRILGSAQSDGAFYTNNISALLLARLTFTADMVDWSDPRAIARLRIMDPACGTGTLLMASLQTIKAHNRRHAAGTPGEEASGRAAIDAAGEPVGNTRDAQAAAAGRWLHRHLVEDVLCGLDINQHAIQLAACNMTLGAPTVDYARMNLVTMPHGPQDDGSVKAGSLDILDASDRIVDLATLRAPQRSFDFIEARQVSDGARIDFPLRNLDAVIMNAPFTDNRKRNRKFTPAAVKRMQAHELALRDSLEGRDEAAIGVVTTNSISTFFTPLADRLLHDERGVLAKVIPVTACTGASGLAERRYLARRFHIERIVTTHDPKKIAFSENTSIHESLLICRRHQGTGPRPVTRFVSLRRMPQNAEEAAGAAQAILDGDPGDWGSTCAWPTERIAAGDWTPAQWYDGELARIAWRIEQSPLLEPVGLRHAVGPAGQRIRDAYEICDDAHPQTFPGFHSVSSTFCRTLQATPDVFYRVKPGKEKLAARYGRERNHLLVAMRYDTHSGRLSGLWSDLSALGSNWVPVAVDDVATSKALAAWWNTTPVRLMLLNRRGKKLTYASWELAHLRQIRIPKPGNPGWDILARAYDRVCETELLPLARAQDCEARKIIDTAAAEALETDETTVAGWRKRLANEPTVTNQRAEKSTNAQNSSAAVGHR